MSFFVTHIVNCTKRLRSAELVQNVLQQATVAKQQVQSWPMGWGLDIIAWQDFKSVKTDSLLVYKLSQKKNKKNVGTDLNVMFGAETKHDFITG